MRATSARSASAAAELSTSLQLDLLFARQRRELDLDLLEQVAHVERRRRCGLSAPESMREMSSSADMISSTAFSEASIDWASVAEPGAAGPLDQRRRIEPRRVERLQQVVARRRQEARLVAVGGIGLGARDSRARN